MAAQSIAFVELYTGGQETAVDYLGSALGFTAVAESTDPESHSVLWARGFGSANIRALYEAVERDRLAVQRVYN